MAMNKMHIIGAACIIFAASLWGIDGIILRPSLYHLDVAVVVFLEHAIAFLIMSVFLMYDIKLLRKIGLRSWLSLFWIALFGGAIGTMAITKALFYVNFEHLSVILILQKLQPIFAIIMAFWILKERPPRQFYTWTFIALVGSYLITFGFGSPVFEGNKLFIASMLSLLAAFSWGSSTVFGRRAVTKVNYRVATYVRFGLTSLLLLAFIIATDKVPKIGSISESNLLTLITIAFTTGGLAIFIYYYGLRRIQASKATIYELSFPITAIILDFVLNGNVLAFSQWIGAIFILGAMIRITQLRVSYQSK